MRKKFSIIIFLLVICLSTYVFFIKKADLDYVKASEWRYENGIKIGEGDFVDFGKESVFLLKEDTIFFKNKPKAIIKSTNKLFHYMIVKDFETGSKGKYIDMEGHFEGIW